MTLEEAAKLGEIAGEVTLDYLGPKLDELSPDERAIYLMGCQMAIWSVYRALGVPKDAVLTIAGANINEVYSL